jgi:mannose-6-phosphate isomerase-like protein (cupin superfamily)
MDSKKINVFEQTKDVKEYTNFVIGEVNDHVVRAAVIDGEFHWHKHENCDELFMVLEGELFIDFEDGTVSLKPGTSTPLRQMLCIVRVQTAEPSIFALKKQIMI